MEKWYYDNKKKICRIAIITISVLTVMYIAWVIYINVTARRRVYKDYNMGESFEYNGARITFDNYNVYSSDEFMKKYELKDYEVPSPILEDNCTVFVAGYEMEKISENAQGPDWTEVYMYSLETKNPTELVLSDLISKDAKPFDVMEINEKVYREIAVYMYDFKFIVEHRDSLDKINMNLYFPDYEECKYITRVKLN